MEQNVDTASSLTEPNDHSYSTSTDQTQSAVSDRIELTGGNSTRCVNHDHNSTAQPITYNTPPQTLFSLNQFPSVANTVEIQSRSVSNFVIPLPSSVGRPVARNPQDVTNMIIDPVQPWLSQTPVGFSPRVSTQRRLSAAPQKRTRQRRIDTSQRTLIPSTPIVPVAPTSLSLPTGSLVHAVQTSLLQSPLILPQNSNATPLTITSERLPVTLAQSSTGTELQDTAGDNGQPVTQSSSLPMQSLSASSPLVIESRTPQVTNLTSFPTAGSYNPTNYTQSTSNEAERLTVVSEAGVSTQTGGSDLQCVQRASGQSVVPASSPSLLQQPEGTQKNTASSAASDDEPDGCMICFESYTNSGAHRMASLKCGHLFGQSCIEKWLKGKGKCPQCNCPAKKADVRIIYAKVLRALDTCERDRALQDLENEREARRKAQLEEAQIRLRFQQTMQEYNKLKLELERKNQQLQSMSVVADAPPHQFLEAVSSDHGGSFTLEKTLKIWESGGCRVMAYCPAVNCLVISQPSSNPLFPGFGVKKISTLDFKTSQYVPLHTKPIRDAAFNPMSADCILLSGSMDKKLKLTSMNSNTVVHTYTNENPVWACCWNQDDGNYFYAGLANGIVCMFDIRSTSDCVSKLNTQHRGPIVSLQYIPNCPQASFRPGGLLVGQIDRSTFYENKQNLEHKPHLLPLESKLVSLSFEDSTRHILATYRPGSFGESVKHQMYELTCTNMSESATVIDNVCSCHHVSTFHGGRTQKLLVRTKIFAHPSKPGHLIGCAGDEASSSVQIWDPSSGILMQKIATASPVIDMCSFKVQQNNYLVTMTEKQLFVYRYQ